MSLRVLIVDDEPLARRGLLRLLREAPDVEVVGECGDGASAVEAIGTLAPDLVFLDIVLPGMDGFNALRTLRRDPATKHVPIIMISGNAAATEQFYVQRIGADDFMKKPFSRAEVFSRIEPLLDAGGVPRHSSKPGTRAEAAAAADGGA